MAGFEDAKQRLLSQTPLDELIAESVNLQNRSGRLLGCCPFHAEKTPSFYIYDDHYHCFGCGAHGDAISFVQFQQGLGFIEALKWLSKKYGIKADELEMPGKDFQKWKKDAQLSRVLLDANEFFRENLMGEQGKEAREYLKQRGFKEEQWQEFGFGYALDEPHALINEMKKRGYTLNHLETTSLANTYQNRSYDFFRHRLTVSICDIQGRLVAFGGRALGDQQQKYKNSRYDKGKLLFALDKARSSMRKKSRGIVVEGYLDALKMSQYGFSETVACQGTALTNDHMKALRSACNLVYLLFDGDKAGLNASLKVLKTSLDFPEIHFKVALLPEGEDPDSFLQKNDANALEEIFSKCQDLLDFGITEKLKTSHSSAIPHTINNELIPWLAKISDPIQKSFLCQKISQLSGVNLDAIKHALSSKDQRSLSANYSHQANPVTPFDDNAKNNTQIELSQRKPSPLNSFVFEFTGHLYFSSNEDMLDLDELSTFIHSHADSDEVWLYFIDELIEKLKQGSSPYKEEATSWVTSQCPSVLELIQKFKERHTAFEVSDRKKMLLRLRLIDKQNKIKSTISSVKERMTNHNNSLEIGEVEWRKLGHSLIKLHQDLLSSQRDLQQV